MASTKKDNLPQPPKPPFTEARGPVEAQPPAPPPAPPTPPTPPEVPVVVEAPHKFNPMRDNRPERVVPPRAVELDMGGLMGTVPEQEMDEAIEHLDAIVNAPYEGKLSPNRIMRQRASKQMELIKTAKAAKYGGAKE